MRAGTRIYKGVEVPVNCKIHTNLQGEEFYIFGVFLENDEYLCNVKFIDNKEPIIVDYKKMKRYIDYI